MGNKAAFFTSRDVLWYLVFCGFAVNYMIRININIAIVAMIKRPQRTGQYLESECIELPNISMAINQTEHVQVMNPTTQENTFLWDEKQQGLVLGAFFWLHWITQLPGGILAQKYGTKAVFGLSQLATCIICYLIPVSAYWSINALLFVRFFQGLIAGMAWPAMHSMAAKWIPPNERSKFVTAYLGSSVGAAITFPMCGVLIDWFNWEAVFYVSGTIGILWYIAWWAFVFDTPAEHPRISQEERRYIEMSIGQSITQTKLKIPWKEILLSRPVWMNTLAQLGGVYGVLLLLTQSPTYFKNIHGLNIRTNGFLSGLPHVLRMIFAFIFSHIGDYLLKKDKISRTNLRKLATVVCVPGQAVFMLALAFAGCDATAAVVYLTAATAVNGSVSTGPLASLIDLSPNFASITLGICAMVTILPGFVSPAIVGYLTYQNQTVGQWKIVYLQAFGLLFVTGLLHFLFSESELQSWNSPEGLTSEKEKLNTENQETIACEKLKQKSCEIEEKTEESA